MSKLTFAGLTDSGRRRRQNEDRWLIDAPLGLFTVADGMGGSSAGEVAAQLIVATLPALIRKHLRGLPGLASSRAGERMQSIIQELNGQVWAEASKNPRLKGMGSTVVFTLVWEKQALITHVGDSRVYLCRGTSLQQLTRDHSTVQRLIDQKKITAEQAEHHPQSGELTRFIGMGPQVVPDIGFLQLQPDDVLMLCSDGLSGMLSDAEIHGILSLHLPPAEACRLLIDSANLMGGDDNITVIVVMTEPAVARRRTGLHRVIHDPPAGNGRPLA